METIGFIGGGNMAEALVKGLLDQGYDPDSLWVSDPSQERCDVMRSGYGIRIAAGNPNLLERCTTLVLAIKPQLVERVVPELAAGFASSHLLISILAGTSTARLETLLGDSARVIRVMPNTPALVGAGVSALAGGRHASRDDLDLAERLLGAVGTTCVIDEAQMDAVTGLSGSGPAYVFAFIKALAEGGRRQGLDADQALELATRTVLGAAQLVAATGDDPAVLRARVCSPGGTTLAGLSALEESGFSDVVIEAVARATRRSRELGKS